MDIKYLNEERIKLWEKIADLEQILKEKSSDLEIEVRQHAENARIHLTEIKTSLAAIKERRAEVEVSVNDIQALTKVADESTTKLQTDEKAIAMIKEKAESTGTEIESWHTIAQSKFNEIEAIFNNNAAIVAKLAMFETQSDKATELSGKIDGIHKSITSRKSDIDETFYEIFGYVEKDETTGLETKVNGLKDELDETYRQLKLNFSTHEASVLNSINDLSKRLADFEAAKKSDYILLVDSWKNDFEKVKARIESLLPTSLTAGLSAAYFDKKEQEIKESLAHARTFRYAIAGMIAVSLIPFGVSIHSLYDSLPLSDAILRLPRLVLSILPLYIPVTWIAYSENRKGNLSKRLIEEYSHKEALSRTYEGLSTQINSLGENDTANELRVKLLYNVLEVSSENPGKLISDYNKSDHPVMDALDKSVKLTNSIEKLTKIPGFTKLAKKLSNKADKLLEKQMEKADQGLDESE